MQTINQGNNEQISRGLVQNENGYLALTFSQSKQFKSRSAAVKWLAKRGVVWCGVVWCGVVWCGVVWCGVVWCGVVWCGVVWCGVVW